MSDALKIRRALLSVYDKTGIVDFARALHEEFGIELISTGGTARVLKDADLPVTLVEEITGFPELMDGRVKTLHPRIHAAILADRDNPEHLRQLAEQGIEPIDMVVVNLYPLEKTIAKPDCTFEEAIEMIDIGGPCLLRAAAKNHKHVLVCTLSRQLDEVLKLLRSGDQSAWDRVRSEFARQVFWSTGTYDGEIESWLSRRCPNGDLGDRLLRLLNGRGLRYGENPHQEADYFMLCDDPRCDAVASQVGQAQAEISFNNYVDASAALELCAELTSVWHRLPAGGPMWHRLPAGGGTGRMPVPRKKMWQPIGEELQTRGNLPHIQKPGKTYFVTFRLRQGELPPTARDIALDACRFWQGKKMNLHIAAVMPNHVHMLLTPFEIESGEAVPLGELLHSIKSFSSNEINKLLGRSGSLWLDENWDRIMRSQKEFVETWEYIETNAERAGLGEAYRWIWKGTTGFEETGLVRRQDAGLTASAHRLEAGA
ncbi:MAG: hypothetical protein KAY37_17495, partial [Phycisphaerae bacterium]|nr:hypothetical protein [Phycisphaerae bacterium]